MKIEQISEAHLPNTLKHLYTLGNKFRYFLMKQIRKFNIEKRK